MRARKENPEWVMGLRAILRDTVGAAFRVYEDKSRAKLDIRLDDGSRKYKTLPIPWDKAHARRIQETVETINKGIKKGLSVDEAIRRTQISDAVKISHQPNPKIILEAWKEFEKFKIKDHSLDQGSFNKKYGGDKNLDLVPPRTHDQGATYLRIKANATAEDANDLLNKVTDGLQAGSRYRKQIVGATCRFLEFATGAKAKQILDPDKWTPPPQNSQARADYVGAKPRETVKQEEEEGEVVTFSDEEIFQLIESLPYHHEQESHAMAARRWIFAIQILATYGLRPEELLHLKLKEGKLWSTYIKRSGGGYGKPRELMGFHPEWVKDWNLIERFKRGEELPKPYKVGAALNKYLEKKEYWEELRKKKNVSSYSFRHTYSKRLHLEYGMDNKSASDLMGHTEEVHIKNYKDKWGNNKESIMEKAMLYRDLHTTKGKRMASTL